MKHVNIVYIYIYEHKQTRTLKKKHVFEKGEDPFIMNLEGFTNDYFGEAGANNKKSWSKNLRRHFLQGDLASEPFKHVGRSRNTRHHHGLWTKGQMLKY